MPPHASPSGLISLVALSLALGCAGAPPPPASKPRADQPRARQVEPAAASAPADDPIVIDPPPPVNERVEIVPQVGHAGSLGFKNIAGAAFLEGQPQLVTLGERDATLKVWDERTGRIVRSTPASMAALSPRGRHGLSVLPGGQIEVTDVARGKKLGSLLAPGPEEGATFVFAEGGEQVAVVREGEALVFNLANAVRLGRVTLPELSTSYALQDGGKRLAVGTEMGEIELFDVDTGKRTQALKGPACLVDALAFSADGKRLLSACGARLGKLGADGKPDPKHTARPLTPPPPAKKKPGLVKTIRIHPTPRGGLGYAEVRLWDIAARKALKTMYAPGNCRSQWVTFSRDGRSAFLAANDLQRFDLDTGRLTLDLAGSLPRNPEHCESGLMALSADNGRALLRESQVWDIDAKKRVFSLPRIDFGVVPFADFSPDGRYAVHSSMPYLAPAGLHVWDLSTASLATFLPTPVDEKGNFPTALFAPRYTADGKLLVARSGAVLAYDQRAAGAPKVLFSLPDDSSSTAIAAHPKGEWVAVEGWLQGMGAAGGIVLHGKVQEPPKMVARDLSSLSPIELSSDGKRMAYRAATGNRMGVDKEGLKVIDPSTGAVVQEWWADLGNGVDLPIALSADGKLVAASHGDSLRLFDVDTGAALSKLGERPSSWPVIRFSPDGKLLAKGVDGGVELWDVAKRAKVRALKGLVTPPLKVGFLGGGRVGAITLDGTVRVWSPDAGHAASFYAEGAEWLATTDDGYFDASPRGGYLVSAVSADRPYGVEQLAARYNRPDVILQRLGVGDPALLAHLQARHKRRLQRMGLREGATGVSFDRAPRAKVAAMKQEGRAVELRVELAASGADLARYNVYVDDVPVHGATGKPVSGREASLTEKVELLSGDNKIEVGVTDADGVESIRDLRMARWQGTARGRLYLLAFGVSRYKDERLNLSWPHKDVLDLAELLKGAKGQFDDVRMATYVNEQVTTDNIKKAKDFLSTTTVDDAVVLFVAGHGTHSRDAAADYFYVTHDTDVSHLRETAARFELIEDLLQGIGARTKLFLLDTCESGEREPGAAPAGGAGPGQRGLRVRTTRALELDVNEPSKPPSSRPYLLQRDRYIYNDLSRRSGAVVLSSSRGAEVSFELDELQNGVFTEAILTALTSPAADKNHDGLISTDELRAFVAADVARRTNDRQHPVVDRDNIHLDFGLPVLAGSASIVNRTEPAR